jgi:hypothetical protein
VKANIFFQSLSKSYKQGYCDWVGSAKQEQTRLSRADKVITDAAKGPENLENLIPYSESFLSTVCVYLSEVFGLRLRIKRTPEKQI